MPKIDDSTKQKIRINYPSKILIQENDDLDNLYTSINNI